MRTMLSLVLIALVAVPATTLAQSRADLSGGHGPRVSSARAAATSAASLVSNGKTVPACDARLSASFEGMAELTCGQELSKTTDSEMAAAENASDLSYEEERQVTSATLLQQKGKRKGIPTPLLTAIVVAVIVSVWWLARVRGV